MTSLPGKKGKVYIVFLNFGTYVVEYQESMALAKYPLLIRSRINWALSSIKVRGVGIGEADDLVTTNLVVSTNTLNDKWDWLETCSWYKGGEKVSGKQSIPCQMDLGRFWIILSILESLGRKSCPVERFGCRKVGNGHHLSPVWWAMCCSLAENFYWFCWRSSKFKVPEATCTKIGAQSTQQQWRMHKRKGGYRSTFFLPLILCTICLKTIQSSELNDWKASRAFG